MDTETAPFEIPPDEISDRSARYRGELERRAEYLTPAQQEWLEEHLAMIKSLGDH